MGKIVAISGGDLTSTDNLNRYAIQLTGKTNPNILFIPTASEDANGYIENIKQYYDKHKCQVESLCLYKSIYSKEKLEEMFQHADLIYVGGGDTESMLVKWKENNVGDLLLDAYKNDKVITGISAGAIIWFQCGHSDSEWFKDPDNWNYKFVKGLDIYHAAFCPHYNESGRESFDDMLENLGIMGLALENDVAFVSYEGRDFIKKANEKAHAYLIKYNKSIKEKMELKENEGIVLLKTRIN